MSEQLQFDLRERQFTGYDLVRLEHFVKVALELGYNISVARAAAIQSAYARYYIEMNGLPPSFEFQNGCKAAVEWYAKQGFQ